MFLTLRCNCKCDYCDFQTHIEDHELSANQIIHLIGKLKKQGLFRLGLSGGEPLLRDDFSYIARGVSAMGLLTSLVTNGIYLDKYSEDAILIDYVLCTIEGDQTLHDLVRGSGTWEKATTGLTQLKRLGHKRLGVICPLHNRNVHLLEEPLRLAEDLGAKVFYQPVQYRPGWRGAVAGDPIDPVIQQSVFERILSWKRGNRSVGNSYQYLKMLARHPDPRASARDICLAGRYFHTILPDGTLLPCCMLDWKAHQKKMVIDNPQWAIRNLEPPSCEGCTIFPYVENSLLLKPNLASIWNSLRW